MGFILPIFFFSGTVALIYQTVWMRELSLIFGVTTFATATVLATFMGGLSLGSVIFGRRSDRFGSPLLVYAALELAIGLYALCLPLLFDGLRYPYIGLYRAELPYGVLAFGRASLAALVILAPTIFMGGTLPVLASLLIRSRGLVGRHVSLLYAVNTAGAVAGCLVGGFYLIENFGLTGSTRVAAGVNFALAALSVVAHRLEARERSSGPVAPQPLEHGPAPVSPAVARLVLVVIGISGFTALAHEVFWTRALLRYLYNSTYAFTTMLMVFLSGLALGSWLCTVLPFRRSRPVLVLAALELGVGLGFLFSAELFPSLGSATFLSLGGTVNSFGEAVSLMLFRATLVLFLPAVLLGATIPLATEICTRQLRTVGRTVGRVYAFNTLGAILGSVAAAFVLIPGLGMRGTLLLLILTNVVAAAALALVVLETSRERLATGVVAIALLLLVPISLAEDHFRRTFTGPRGGKLVFYKEGSTDTVGVVEGEKGERNIRYEDQRGTAGTASYPINYFLGHLPVMLHPGHPKLALHICFGVGNSLSALAAHESIERVDSVELSPHVLEAAKYFWTNNGVIDSPKVNSIIDDGRNYVMASDRVYDVIALEPPLIYTAGVINLFAREFYENAAARLADDGILLQWVPVGEAPLEDERMLFRAFYEVFPHGTAWQHLWRNGNILLIGSKRPLEIDYQLLKQKFEEPRVRRDMELSGVAGVDEILAMLVFDSHSLARFVEGVAPVTDDNTVLDFSMPRYLGASFGFAIGTHTPRAEAGGRSMLNVHQERTEYYYGLSRSAVPALVNLEGEDPSAVARRIRSIQLPRGHYAPSKESEWNRWPEEGIRRIP